MYVWALYVNERLLIGMELDIQCLIVYLCMYLCMQYIMIKAKLIVFRHLYTVKRIRAGPLLITRAAKIITISLMFIFLHEYMYVCIYYMLFYYYYIP